MLCENCAVKSTPIAAGECLLPCLLPGFVPFKRSVNQFQVKPGVCLAQDRILSRVSGPSETSENTCPAPTPAQNHLQMNAPQKQSSLSGAASENQPAKAPPEQEHPATLGQKIFIVGLYLYALSLVWLTLSHYWYGILPKWLDPH